MSKKKFFFLWFSPSDRKFLRPQLHVELGIKSRGNAMTTLSNDMNSTLPSWTSDFRLRRAVALATSATLILIWAICVSSIKLGWIQYLVLSLLMIAALGLLNFSFRSIFDLPDEILDERLYSLRNKYAFRSYQAMGVLLLLMMALVHFSILDPSRLWLPVIATYASIPYLFLGWQEKTNA